LLLFERGEGPLELVDRGRRQHRRVVVDPPLERRDLEGEARQSLQVQADQQHGQKETAREQAAEGGHQAAVLS